MISNGVYYIGFWVAGVSEFIIVISANAGHRKLSIEVHDNIL